MADTDPADLAAALAPRLALLRALAADEHVTRAADAVGVPQPTVSRWLADLADTLGGPVLSRHGRGVRLTRAGRELAAAAGAALSTVEAGVRRAVAENDPDAGTVVFAFLHTMGGARVPGLLRAFRTHHPRVRFSLVQGAHEEMLHRVLAGDVDLALTAPLPVDHPRLHAAVLEEQPLVLAVPATHRLADRRRVRIAELADEEFIGMKPGYGLRRITDDLCAAAGFAPRLSFTGEEVDTIRGLVVAGLGVAVLPPADQHAPRGMREIAIVPRAYRTIGLVWPADRPLSPAADGFRDFVLG
ncbi:LysR family transcriptional regulator [Actinocatenispora rupis]|uniref:LysR family transcriptional regulator n=1 Tax=Actinocatenispora rupis TaxID=519421 RepID=A0A8J3J6G0_9ACTN|nr:LysR family transcriptional regulator [Actinocatenispora rupis]GID10258.1 LysR family transcriptional regulator [Actinocatenispora rupis]